MVIFMLIIIISSLVFSPLKDRSGANRSLLKHCQHTDWAAVLSYPLLLVFCICFTSSHSSLCFANRLAAKAYIKVTVIWWRNFKSPKYNLKMFRFLYCVVTVANKKVHNWENAECKKGNPKAKIGQHSLSIRCMYMQIFIHL